MRFQHLLSLFSRFLLNGRARSLTGIALAILTTTTATTVSYAALPTPDPNSSIVSSKISWSSLTPGQKVALAPLAAEWDTLEDLPKRKWLVIANKYTGMKPDEQQRIQERLKTWAKLSPEQRMAVRENFSNTSKKTPEQKSTQWQKYQQLSEEEKLKLANAAKTKRNVTAIQPESKRTAPVLAPIKKGPTPAAVKDSNTLASQTINK